VLDVSGDGSVMVGTVTENGVAQAFRWTAGGGIGGGLGFLPGASYSEAYGVSPDGSVVVGQALNDAGQPEAFRWTDDDGMIGLGQLPGGDFSGADAVSADGSVVVGVASALFQEGFRWTAAGGMVGLGMAVGTVFLTDSLASDVSADGSVIVGNGHLDTSPPDTSAHALIWDPIHGWRLVEEVLVSDYGLDLTGWTLTAATAISGDGLTLVGFGTNPEGEGEGWIAHLASVPEPAASLLLFSWRALCDRLATEGALREVADAEGIPRVAGRRLRAMRGVRCRRHQHLLGARLLPSVRCLGRRSGRRGAYLRSPWVGERRDPLDG
jgi:probable HAF family extracellular repeat protein